ncbi:MAG: rRNA maturation RNase YbeY [Spirochaetaceae bacterium]|jgi:probable rRNA maturation factor|nr:rRNA maturation RNase YbeY [Spirochaetaceae bacterium]
MNRVDISAEGVALPDWTDAAAMFVTAVCDRLLCENWDTSVLFCNDNFIQELNRRFRNKDEPTDVLSFPLGGAITEDGEERYTSGDIVISLETLRANCNTFNTGEDEELRRLLIHGILHLKGFDHATNEPGEEMLLLQEKLLAEMNRIIINR